MKKKREIIQELFQLMTTEAGPTDEQIYHRAGRIRSLVWILTGEDVGYDCLRDTAQIVETLGWKWWKEGGKIYFEVPNGNK